MAVGHLVYGSRHMVLLMHLYLICATLLVADGFLVNKSKCSSVFYASEAIVRDNMPSFVGHVKRTTSVMKPYSLSTKLISGTRLIWKTQLMAMLILLSNDVEMQPGPVSQAEMFESLPKVKCFKVGHLTREVYETRRTMFGCF
jgi:hypothetical protein